MREVGELASLAVVEDSSDKPLKPSVGACLSTRFNDEKAACPRKP